MNPPIMDETSSCVQGAGLRVGASEYQGAETLKGFDNSRQRNDGMAIIGLM